jgi:hypothetical protein
MALHAGAAPAADRSFGGRCLDAWKSSPTAMYMTALAAGAAFATGSWIIAPLAVGGLYVTSNYGDILTEKVENFSNTASGLVGKVTNLGHLSPKTKTGLVVGGIAAAGTLLTGGGLLAAAVAGAAFGGSIAKPSFLENINVTEEQKATKLLDGRDNLRRAVMGLKIKDVKKYSKFVTSLLDVENETLIKTIINCTALNTEEKLSYLTILAKGPLTEKATNKILTFAIINDKQDLLSQINPRNLQPADQVKFVKRILASQDNFNKDSYLLKIAPGLHENAKNQILTYAIDESKLILIKTIIESIHGDISGPLSNSIDRAIRSKSSEEVFTFFGEKLPRNTSIPELTKFMNHVCKCGYKEPLSKVLGHYRVYRDTVVIPADQLKQNLESIIAAKVDDKTRKTMIVELLNHVPNEHRHRETLKSLLEITLDYALEQNDDTFIHNILKNRNSKLCMSILSSDMESERREAIRVACRKNNPVLLNILIKDMEISESFKKQLLTICDRPMTPILARIHAVNKFDRFAVSAPISLSRSWRHFKRWIK